MSSCNSCGVELEGTEKFCGACGKLVEQSVERTVEAPVESPPPAAEIKPSPKQEPSPSASKSPESQIPSPASGKKSNLPVYVIAGLLVVVGVIFLSQQGNDAAPVATNHIPAASNITPTAPAAPAARIETTSDAVRDYLKAATQANIDGGIAAIAPHRMLVPSCANCAPVMIYCIEPFGSVSDLKGRAIRAHSSSAKALVGQVGGNLQLLMFGEVSQAMQMGLIDCSMSGGIVPQ